MWLGTIAIYTGKSAIQYECISDQMNDVAVMCSNKQEAVKLTLKVDDSMKCVNLQHKLSHPLSPSRSLSLSFWTVCAVLGPGWRCVTVTCVWCSLCVCVCVSQRSWSVPESHVHLCPPLTAHQTRSWPTSTPHLTGAARRYPPSARVPGAPHRPTAAETAEPCRSRRAPERPETAATPTRAKKVRSCSISVLTKPLEVTGHVRRTGSDEVWKCGRSQ